jgi:8-oxo-dGTP pyrophosphatase MutT (NUDIX family)
LDDEIASLTCRFGAARRRTYHLDVQRLFSAVDTRPERVAEVVFAVQRPDGRLLLHTKSFYPSGAWRLPSGSMEAGEGIESALLREAGEETSLQVTVVRFLAIIDYAITTPDEIRDFRTYAFLLREGGGHLAPADLTEGVVAYREVWPGDLPGVAEALESLARADDDAARQWADWGRFRAIVHRVVWEALNSPAGTDPELPWTAL